MTPAERYLAGLYERAVDAQLDVSQIRDYLATRGVRRSVFQVVDELERVHGFSGYAAAHAAPLAQTLEQIDRQFV